MSFLRGHLLVAMPKLLDPNFFRTVSLMVEHNEQGALGLVLNRPSDLTIREVWQEVRQTPCALDSRVYLGGPCPGYLTALHTVSRLSDREVLPGLYFSQTPGHLERLVKRAVEPIRFFLGFAGWSDGQLETELEEGSWLSGPASLEDAFQTDDEFWGQSLQRLAGPGLTEILHIKQQPAQPSAN